MPGQRELYQKLYDSRRKEARHLLKYSDLKKVSLDNFIFETAETDPYSNTQMNAVINKLQRLTSESILVK